MRESILASETRRHPRPMDYVGFSAVITFSPKLISEATQAVTTFASAVCASLLCTLCQGLGRRLSEVGAVVGGESSGVKKSVFKSDVANLDHGGIAVLENLANS